MPTKRLRLCQLEEIMAAKDSNNVEITDHDSDKEQTMAMKDSNIGSGSSSKSRSWQVKS